MDYQLTALSEHLREQIEGLKDQRANILLSIESLLPIVDTLPLEKRELVEKLAENAARLQDEADKLEDELLRDKKTSDENAEHTIFVKETLFAETKVYIQKEWHKFKQPLSGPLKIECVNAKVKAKSTA